MEFFLSDLCIFVIYECDVIVDSPGISFQYVNYGTNSATFPWNMMDIVSVLKREEGYTVKYGLILPYIPT